MNWTDFVSIISALVAIAAGIGGAPAIVQALKQQFGLQGNGALVLSVAVAVVVGVGMAIAEGAITGASFTAESAGRLILTVWTASQIQYIRITNAEP